MMNSVVGEYPDLPELNVDWIAELTPTAVPSTQPSSLAHHSYRHDHQYSNTSTNPVMNPTAPKTEPLIPSIQQIRQIFQLTPINNNPEVSAQLTSNYELTNSRRTNPVSSRRPRGGSTAPSSAPTGTNSNSQAPALDDTIVVVGTKSGSCAIR